VRLGQSRLPRSLLCSLTLRFLSRENRLAFRLGLARDLGEALCLGLTRCLGGFCVKTSSDLRFFLALAFGFFFLTPLLFRESFFYTQAGLFAGLRSRSGEIAVFRAVQICPGIKCCDIFRSRCVALFDLGLGTRRVGICHSHLQLSTATLNCRISDFSQRPIN